MNRYRYITKNNDDENEKPFHACIRCGRIYKKDYSCCTEKPIETKPSDLLPNSRGSFKTKRFAQPTPFEQIWNAAIDEMDTPLDPPTPPPSDDFEDY